MTDEELERKAVKESLRYNTKYAEDSELDKVLKYPEKFVDHFKHAMCIVKLLREKAYRDGYIAGAKELQKENEQLKTENERLKQELLTYKNAICNKECAEVWGESERLKEENEQLKKYNTELCERLEAVAKESGKALTRQIIAESIVADLQKEKVVWHDLRKNPNDLPKAGKLVRVRLSSGMEHICETEYYEPSEDEIGFGKLIISFYELNGEWVDDTEIIAWCEIPKFEVEE